MEVFMKIVSWCSHRIPTEVFMDSVLWWLHRFPENAGLLAFFVLASIQFIANFFVICVPALLVYLVYRGYTFYIDILHKDRKKMNLNDYQNYIGTLFLDDWESLMRTLLPLIVIAKFGWLLFDEKKKICMGCETRFREFFATKKICPECQQLVTESFSKIDTVFTPMKGSVQSILPEPKEVIIMPMLTKETEKTEQNL